MNNKFCNIEEAPIEDDMLVKAARAAAPRYSHLDVVSVVLMATFESLSEEGGLPSITAMRMPKDPEHMFATAAAFVMHMNEVFEKNKMPFSMSLTLHHHMCGQKEVIVDGVASALVGKGDN